MFRVLTSQPRVGQYSEVFWMYKFSGDSRFGWDEAAQILNIIRREMKFIGPRPIQPADHDSFMDTLDPDQQEEYTRKVMTQRPGVFSTLSLRRHLGESLGHRDRYEQNIQDSETPRPRLVWKMARLACRLALQPICQRLTSHGSA